MYLIFATSISPKHITSIEIVAFIWLPRDVHLYKVYYKC